MDKELETLIRGIRRGERETLDDFYTAYGREISKHLHTAGFKKDDIKDISQEVLVKIWRLVKRKRITCRTVQEANAYVRTSAMNAARSLMRKRKKEKDDVSLDDDEQNLTATLRAVSVQNRERSIHLRRKINELPDGQRKVFILCKVEGFSYAEAAARLRITENQVRRLLSLARQELKKNL